MTKNKFIPIIIIVLLILTAGYFGFMNQRKSKNEPLRDTLQKTANNTVESNPTDTRNSDDTGIKKVNGSILDLMKLGIPQKCTFSSNEDSTKVNGTTVVSGKRVKSDFTVETEDMDKIESHMLTDGEWAYMWSNGMPQGIKMKFNQEDMEKAQKDALENQNLKDIQKEYDYRCTPWIVDNSVFDIPSDVNFADFSETINMYKNVPTTLQPKTVEPNEIKPDTSEVPSNMCGTCNLIQDAEAKASCKASFKCN